MNTGEKFVSYFTSKYNFIKSSDLEVIGYTDNLVLVKKFGYRYSVYVKGLNWDAFSEVIDTKEDYEKALNEYNRRKDPTAQMSVDEKIDLVECIELKSYIQKKVSYLRAQCHGVGFIPIQANGKLNQLRQLTLKEFIETAKQAINDTTAKMGSSINGIKS